MARIAVLTTNIAGRMNASFEMARKLTAAGHELTVLSHRDSDGVPDEFRARYRRLPAPQVPVHEVVVSKPRVGRLLGLVRRLSAVQRLASRRSERIDQLNAEAVMDLIADLSPDLVLVDIEMPVEIMAARATDLPVAIFNDMYSVWRRPGLPPLSSDIVPGRGWRGTSWWIAVSWYAFLTHKWAQRVRYRITRVGLDRRSVLEGVADRTGFSLDEETSTAHWLIPFVYVSMPTLALNALEVEFPHEPPPNVTYVGPQISEARSGELQARRLAGEELVDVLARCSADATRSLVYCSFGAFGGVDPSILGRVIEAIGDAERWELVVGLGGKGHEIPDLLPANVHLYSWAPQLDVLRQADFAIHHAGTHTVNECIRNHVPMLVYPDDELDHRGNAARVAYHGLGVVGDVRTDTAAIIKKHIETCLNSPNVSDNLRRMASAFGAYETSGALTAAVERLLAR